MGAPPLSDDQCREAVEVRSRYPSDAAAALAMGISRSAFQNRLAIAKSRRFGEGSAPRIELPVLDDEHEPIEEVINRMTRNFERAKKAHDAKQWFSIKISETLPIGILFVGDPHVDDNGCAWPILRRHAQLCASTPGMYAVNIGDSSNCWGGRLIKKYADQDASVHTARRLVEWLLLSSGFKWLVWLMGNHEHMGDGAPLLHEMNKRHGTTRVPMLDWTARFTLDFPNGEQIRIHCAHDFPGNSMWNPVHGPVKAAMFGDRVDLLVCGHKHNWAISQWELAEQGTSPLMVRTRGYKHHDDFAKKIGKHEQEEGQSILVLIDPSSDIKSGRVQAFTDIEKGAKILSWMRASA